jgi:putative transposase
MQVRKAFRYRLYPTQAQADELDRILWRCRDLYNAAVYQRREAYRVCGITVTYCMQQNELPALKKVHPPFREVGSQVLQDVLRRVNLAFDAFFRRVKAGQKPGYPRFRGRDRYDSVTYTQAGWKLDHGKLILTGLGAIKLKWSRPIQGTIKTVTVRRDADQWYVCFSCVVEVADLVPLDRPAVGIDVGLASFAALSDGRYIANPRHFRHGEVWLARRQRVLARKKRGSKNRHRAKLLVAKAHRHVRNQRRDFHHKEARKIVDAHGALAVEGLRIKNMVRNHGLAKSISDAGWNQFLTILTSKAEEAGLVVVVVNPAGTSQTCVCGEPVPKELGERWHACPQCHLSLPRDQVSAMLVLQRAGLSPSQAAPAA